MKCVGPIRTWHMAENIGTSLEDQEVGNIEKNTHFGERTACEISLFGQGMRG